MRAARSSSCFANCSAGDASFGAGGISKTGSSCSSGMGSGCVASISSARVSFEFRSGLVAGVGVGVGVELSRRVVVVVVVVVVVDSIISRHISVYIYINFVQ